MSFVERANAVRWLVYDAVCAPILVWAMLTVSWIYAFGVAMLVAAVFVDVNEVFVKRERRHRD